MRMLQKSQEHWVKFGLTPDECSTGRIEAKRLVEILSRPSVHITQCYRSSNNYGSFMFISFVTFDSKGRPARRLCLFGNGYHEGANRQQDWYSINDEDHSYPKGGFYTSDPLEPRICSIPGPWGYGDKPTTKAEWKAKSHGGMVYGGKEEPSFLNRWRGEVTWSSKREVLDDLRHHAKNAMTYEETLAVSRSSRSKAFAFMERHLGPDDDAITSDLDDHPDLEALLAGE